MQLPSPPDAMSSRLRPRPGLARLAPAALMAIIALGPLWPLQRASAAPPRPLGGQAAAAGSMSTVRYAMAAATVPDRRVFVFGGYDGVNSLSSVEAYSPGTGAWSTARSMPTARYLSAAAVGPDGLVYVIGGYARGRVLRSVDTYNPVTDVWGSAPPLPGARYLLAAATGSDGRVYAIGGNDGTSWVATTYAYSTRTRTWTAAAPLAAARGALAAAEGSDGRIYAVGGSLISVQDVVSTVEAYSPATNSWAAAPSLPARRTGLGLVSGADGKLYAIGGVGSPGFNYAVKNYSYTPGATAWARVPPMPAARYFLAAAAGIGADRNVYAIGGYNGTDAFASTATFSLATRRWTTSAAAVAAASAPPAAARAARPAAGGAASAPADAWTTFRHDDQHSGVSTDTGLGVSKASTLHLAWSAGLGASSFASPAVAFNAVLGKTLVFIGNSRGRVGAYEALTGTPVWSVQVGVRGDAVQTGLAVDGDVLYFGSKSESMYALQASTGHTICSLKTTGTISASPVVGRPDAAGPVVYFGDSGPSGITADGGNEWAMNGVGNTAGACSLRWSYREFGNPPASQPGAGTYSSPALGTDSAGRLLVVFGSTEPDEAVYALDASSGARVWRFQAKLGFDQDVGASPTISAPGVNGLAGGAVYVTSKIAITYALDLTTGAPLWSFDMRANGGGAPSQSGAALVGSMLFLGDGSGAFAIDAVTGSGIWQVPGLAPIISSPSVAGAPGDRIAFAGDLAGKVDAFDLANGGVLWQYQTGGFIYSSPAIALDHVYIAGSDGFLYSFSS